MWTHIISWDLGPKPFQLDFHFGPSHFNRSPIKASQEDNHITYRLPQGFCRKRNLVFFLFLFLFYLFVYSFIFIKKASWSYQSCWGETFSHNFSLLFKIILENSKFISVHYSIFSLFQYPIERCCDYQYKLVFSMFDFSPLQYNYLCQLLSVSKLWLQDCHVYPMCALRVNRTKYFWIARELLDDQLLCVLFLEV